MFDIGPNLTTVALAVVSVLGAVASGIVAYFSHQSTSNRSEQMNLRMEELGTWLGISKPKKDK